MKPLEIAGRFLPALFIVAGLVLLIVGAGHLRQAAASATWPSVDGQVVSSSVSKERRNQRTKGNQRNRRTHGAVVVYDYEVEGQSYRGDRTRIVDLSSGNKERVKKLAAKYPAGSAVAVYYDPSEPSEAVLEPGLHPSSWFVACGGAVFVIAGLFVFRQNWRQWDKWNERARRRSGPGTNVNG